MSGTHIAVDIGGTFTDLVARTEHGRISYAKSLTTYNNLAEGVLACLMKADVEIGDAKSFIHGSTIAINTVIQKRGAVTGLITTRGFRDAYEIGRSNRPDAYNLAYERPTPLIPRDYRMEVRERLDSSGQVREALDEDDVRAAIRALREKGATSIAVVLLHAYANPAHEIRIGELVREEHPNCSVSLSHEILREFREYERTSTTALNAYIAPTVSRYVGDLEDALASEGFNGQFRIMQSNGGTMSADVAKTRPVSMMESGPVAGVIGASQLGRLLEIPNVISFDMGGTTAKSSLVVDGEARVVTGYYIGGYEAGHPMMLPVVDIVEVGTGGGSIAWIDAAGGLKVGPISAGSDPGPVCYSQGGSEPTVTDANLVLGRLDPENFLGGDMRLDRDAAAAAIEERIAKPLGLKLEAAALGIVRIADAMMSLAVREVSVAKGHDPRDFALVASGGAGPLHALAIARELSIPKVIVPELPGTFSAFGMLFTDLRHDYVQTMICTIDQADPQTLNRDFERLAETALKTLASEGVDASAVKIIRSADLRYLGQQYTLTVPLKGNQIDAEAIGEMRRVFDQLHYEQYRHSAPEEPVEIVNLRLSALGRESEHSSLSAQDGAQKANGGSPRQRKVYFENGAEKCQVYQRSALGPDVTVEGPAVIEEQVSTTVLHPGDRARIHPGGPIIIEIGE